MKSSIILFIVLACYASCNRTFLRNLPVATVDMKLGADKVGTLCATSFTDTKIYLELTNDATTKVDTGAIALEIIDTGAAATKVTYTCGGILDTESTKTVECTSTATATEGSYKISTVKYTAGGSSESITVPASPTNRLTIKAGYAVDATTSKSPEIDFSKLTTFEIKFDKAIATTAQKIYNGATEITCAKKEETSTKTLVCTPTKEQLAPDTDATKNKTYAITFADICDAKVASGVTVTVIGEKAASSSFMKAFGYIMLVSSFILF